MSALTPALLLESLDRHFMTGCPSLSTSQLREHEAAGTCLECRLRGHGAQQAAASRPRPAAAPGGSR